MNKIIVIAGFSAAGKDQISQWISKNLGYNFIISDTSRPIRPNESQGNPYNFITKEEFLNNIKNNEYIECRQYNTLVNNIPDIWYYGVHKNAIDLNKNSYVVVLDMLGLMEFKEYFKENIISFFIDVDEPTRRLRCINRSDFNLSEWERRYNDDLKNFSLDIVKKEVDYIVENYDFNKCINEICERLNKNE